MTTFPSEFPPLPRSPSDVVLLSLTGERPRAEVTRAFEIASFFLAPLSMGHASTQALTAREGGATTSTTIGVLGTALGEQARQFMNEHEALLSALAGPEVTLPNRYLTADDGERASVASLAEMLARVGFDLPGHARQATRAAALVCLLYACGLTQREQIEVAIVLACLPLGLAHAFAVAGERCVAPP